MNDLMNIMGVILEKIQDPVIASNMMVTLTTGDVASGYLKAWKFNKLNSSVSRDGFIKKLGWFLGLALGVAIYYFIGVSYVITLVASVCCITEFMSIIENLSQIGVDLRGLKKKFQQLNDEGEQ